MSGLQENSTAQVSIYSMNGRSVFASKVALNRYSPTMVSAELGTGAYMARVTVGRIIAGSAKVLVQ
jgi:hypothetical protein